jgi:hypothetical protein
MKPSRIASARVIALRWGFEREFPSRNHVSFAGTSPPVTVRQWLFESTRTCGSRVSVASFCFGPASW